MKWLGREALLSTWVEMTDADILSYRSRSDRTGWGFRDFQAMPSYGDLSELSSINEQSNDFTKFPSLLPMSKPDYTFRK